MAVFNVQFNDKGAVDEIVQLYTKTAQDITFKLYTISSADIARRKQILAAINAQINQLGLDTGQWIDKYIPMQYKIGMQQAIEQLKVLDFLPRPVDSLFTVINKEAVTAMIGDTSRSFADALTTVGRSVKNIQADIFQREIKARLAEGTITGETRKAISADIKQKIEDQGITALVDKGGRQWSLERYSQMLANTKLAEARNTGLANKMLENGNDLVQVSSNGSTHPICEEYEGEILSISGESTEYDSVDDAESAGLFHPNCQHTLNAIEPDLAEQTYGYDPNTGEYQQGLVGAAASDLAD